MTSQLDLLLNDCDFEYYSLMLRRKIHKGGQDVVLAARWPADWSEIYKAKKYILVDPVIRKLGVAQRPFRWKEAFTQRRSDPRSARIQRLVQDAGRFGLRDGYVFPVHGCHGLLGSMIMGGGRVELSPSEVALFDILAKKMFWRYLEFDGRAAGLEHVAASDIVLTRREMEVVGHLAEGLTSNEIARTLAISHHTVDWYINSLQEKMNARNRQHVVALAFRKGLVT